MAQIKKIQDTTREAMKQKSAQSLPDVPSSKGWTPKKFKDSITKPMFDNDNSLFSEVNRVVEETNKEFEQFDLNKVSHEDAVHKTGFLKEVVTGEKTFETNDGTAPVHLKSSFPYIVSDTASKVGMRAYTEDGEYQGEIAGQFAVSKDDTNENGHFANLQARDNSGDLHTLRVSGKGVSYFKNSERHKIPLDENVVHNLGDETLKGALTIEAVAPSSKDVRITNEHIKLNDASNTLRYVEVTPSTLVLNDFKNSVTIHPQGIYTKNEDEATTYFYNFPKNSGTLATEYFAKNYTDSAIAKIIDNAPQTLDTFKEVATYIASDKTFASQITANVNQNRERITALDNTKADRDELFSKNYDELINAPEKLNIVVRDTISADTYNEAREIQIGKDKFKFGSGSKIKANEFVDGTLPTLEYLNIDGNTYKLPNYVVEKSGLKLVAEGKLEWDEENKVYNKLYDFENGKHYLLVVYDSEYYENVMFNVVGFAWYNDFKTQVCFDYNDDFSIYVEQSNGNTVFYETKECRPHSSDNYANYRVYEIPLGESAQVEKHNKTINALMQRVSDLEQKAGLTSVGYVQDNTLNLIRVNVVDDVLEVSGFKFDGEIMII